MTTLQALQARKCGDCYYWMKSRDCPKERNVNGWNRGPSMSHSICNKFKPTASRLKLEAKFEEL